MVEQVARDRPDKREARGLRNVVNLNFRPDNLGFISAWLSRRARSIRVQELGPRRAVIKMTLPVSSPAAVAIPAAWSFRELCEGADDRALEAVLQGSRQTRLLVVHAMQSPYLIAQIAKWFPPDIVFVEGKPAPPDEWFLRQSLTERREALTPSERRNWGVPSLRAWANDEGAPVLSTIFAMFDNSYQRRKRERSRVYDAKELFLCDGFYPVESEAGNSWAWTGSETVATVLVPRHGGSNLRITLYLFGTTIPVDAENIEVLVDDERCKCEFTGNDKIEAYAHSRREGCSHRVDIIQRRTVPTADGSREIGIALHKLKIEIQ